MFDVNIYIITSIRGPAIRREAGEWIVEFVLRDGTPVTRSGMVYKDRTTENALVLELIRDALSILTKSCSVRVNTECEHVLNIMQNHMLPIWEKNGWNNARGNLVKNMELWQQCKGLMDNHLVEVDRSMHSYYMVMKEDVKKELERRTENV